MTKHIFYGEADLSDLKVDPAHEHWLNAWLEKLQASIEKGEIAASECLQGALIETVLRKPLKVDWLGVFDEYLLDEAGLPMAYSTAYGNKLYKFEAQLQQVTIHSLHTYWFVKKLNDPAFTDTKLTQAVLDLQQQSGWFYNPTVSPTIERYRMRVELFMSLAMALEILLETEDASVLKEQAEARLLAEPTTSYLSAEYFRLRALHMVGSDSYIKSSADKLRDLLTSCTLEKGFSDFDVKSKVDDYMGTAKRVGRDLALLSAISTLHAQSITQAIGGDTEADKAIEQFVAMQTADPLAFGAFKMRELEPDFGPSITAHEIIAATVLRNSHHGAHTH